MFAGDRAELYVDHRLVQSVPYGDLQPTVWNAYVLGVQRPQGGGTVTVQDALFGSFIP